MLEVEAGDYIRGGVCDVIPKKRQKQRKNKQKSTQQLSPSQYPCENAFLIINMKSKNVNKNLNILENKGLLRAKKFIIPSQKIHKSLSSS